MDEKIFDRIEKKYLLTQAQYQSILKIVQKSMKKDVYHRSEVYNIYFDNDNYDLIVKSIESPAFKQKLRARSYGGYDKVFMEIKTKLRYWEPGDIKQKIGYKRRFLLTHDEYRQLISGEKTPPGLAGEKIENSADLQIAREVEYMIQYFNLKPQILVYYRRESYIGENNLRITFDQDLSYRDHDLVFARKPSDQKYFGDQNTVLMEIKAHSAMPLTLAHALTQARAYPQKFSKIGKIYEIIKKGEKNV